MNVKIDKTFTKDVEKIRDTQLRHQIVQIIEETQKAPDFRFIKNLKKLSGYKNFYRIKIASYRIGVMIEGNTIEFIRFSHRKDIYKHFPY